VCGGFPCVHDAFLPADSGPGARNYHILQSAMASSERVFKCSHEGISTFPSSAPHNLHEVAGIEFGRGLVAYKDEEGCWRRQLPHRGGRDRGRGRATRAPEDGRDQPVLLFMNPEEKRQHSRRRRRYTTRRSAGAAPPLVWCCRIPTCQDGSLGKTIRLGTDGNTRGRSCAAEAGEPDGFSYALSRTGFEPAHPRARRSISTGQSSHSACPRAGA